MEVLCSEDKVVRDRRDDSDTKKKYQNEKNEPGIDRGKAEIKGSIRAEKKIGGV